MNPTAQLLNSIIIGSRLVPKVADLANVADATVYAACDGRNNPSVEVIKATYLATGDQRLKRLLEPTGWELVRQEQTRASRDAEGEAMDVVLSVSSFVGRLRQAMADGHVNERERDELLTLLQEVSREVLEARAALCRTEKPGLKVAG